MRIGLIIFVFSFLSATCQTTKGLGDWLKIVNSGRHDTIEINALIETGNIYQNSNPDSAIYYHLLAKNLSREINSPLKTLASFNELIWDYFIKGDFQNAIQAYNDANIVIRKIYHGADPYIAARAKRFEAACVTNIASVYKEKGEYSRALDLYFKAAAINQETGNKNSKASTYSNIASVYSLVGDLVKAIEYDYKALKIFEETGFKLYQAGVLGNIGLIYSKQEKHTKALEYHLKSQAIYNTLQNKQGQANCFANIGAEYAHMHETEKSLNYFFKALQINKEIGNVFGIGQSCGDIAITYQLLADTLMSHGKITEAAYDHEQAMKFYSEAIRISREIGNKQALGYNLMGIASLYASLNDFNKALRFNRHAEQIAAEIGSLNDIREVEYTYYKIYKRAGQAESALHYLKKYVHSRDSMLNEENTKAAVEHEMRFVFEKKAAADSVKANEERKIILAKLNASRESLNAEKNLRYSLYSGIAALILFAFFVVNRYNVINRQKQIIEEQKQLAEHQKQLVEEKQKEILDSIYYARRIQSSMLTSEKYISRVLGQKK